MRTETSRKITCFSFLWCIAVMSYHFNLAVSYRISPHGAGLFGRFLEKLDSWITMSGYYGVEYFFMLSAFLLFYNLQNDEITGKSGEGFDLF